MCHGDSGWAFLSVGPISLVKKAKKEDKIKGLLLIQHQLVAHRHLIIIIIII